MSDLRFRPTPTLQQAKRNDEEEEERLLRETERGCAPGADTSNIATFLKIFIGITLLIAIIVVVLHLDLIPSLTKIPMFENAKISIDTMIFDWKESARLAQLEMDALNAQYEGGETPK